jgi:hypothetical protein
MTAIPMRRGGGQERAKKSAKWSGLVPPPTLDDQSRVGLTFISAGYGVVLVAVFPMKALEYINWVGLSHLALAAFMLVISWMGYYTNRVMYPAWRVQFFNLPLWQYILSFGILLGYWELGITTKASAADPATALWRETIIIVLIFAAYLVWDILEVAVQESGKYIAVLMAEDPHRVPPTRGQYRTWPDRSRRIPPVPKNPHGPFAKDVRARRFVSAIFTSFYVAMLLLVYLGSLKSKNTVIAINFVYIVSLFAYRYLQWIATRYWYQPLGSKSG